MLRLWNSNNHLNLGTYVSNTFFWLLPACPAISGPFLKDDPRVVPVAITNIGERSNFMELRTRICCNTLVDLQPSTAICNVCRDMGPIIITPWVQHFTRAESEINYFFNMVTPEGSIFTREPAKERYVRRAVCSTSRPFIDPKYLNWLSYVIIQKLCHIIIVPLKDVGITWNDPGYFAGGTAYNIGHQ